jgi:hypothetical protein
VWSRNLELEEAKAGYRAVKNTTTMGLTPGKQRSLVYYREYTYCKVAFDRKA